MKKRIGSFILFFIHLVSFAQDFNAPISNWKQDGPLTPNFNGQTFRGWVDALCVHAEQPHEILIATRTSGIFRTNNGGQNWMCVTDSLSETFPVLGCRAMISLPSEPNYVVAITGFNALAGGVIYSSDFGKSWKAVEQKLPTFRWIDFHPNNPNLLFACSDKEVFYSWNKGVNWSSLGAPADTDFTYNEIFKICVLPHSVKIISKARWSAEAFLHEATFKTRKRKKKIRFSAWSENLAPTFVEKEGDKVIFMDFSNRAGKVHYFQLETAKKLRKTFQTSDNGRSYALLNIPNFPVGHWWKNELIASPTDSNFLYWGQVGYMQRYDKRTGKSVFIQPDSLQPGHHDDYRSSCILSFENKDCLVFGHDGGVGLVRDGLSSDPRISNANGDLSINLIHAFDVHEKTGRIVLAYQDGPMFYRDRNGVFSESFLWEGSAAMIHQQNPDAIVGENAYAGISDKDETNRPIVKGVLGNGGCFLGGYFVTYRHYPDRFARGLRNGQIALNRDVNVSEISTLPNTKSDVGALAVCARNPAFIYAATTFPDDGKYKLHRSRDDGKTWENLTTSTVEIAGVVSDLNERLNWSYIKSIAVDSRDGDLVYCGMADSYVPFGEIIPERFRVIRSFDGGQHFVDYSEGLPYVPVDEILSIESDDGLLFCATVYGVFYRNMYMEKWEPFSENLPKVEITGLKYDYCNNVLYASTYGRGLWKTSVGIDVTDTFQEVIQADTVWEEDRILYDHVLVKSGATLTVKAKVEKYRNKEITVEPGGQMILLGGEIWEYCELDK